MNSDFPARRTNHDGAILSMDAEVTFRMINALRAACPSLGDFLKSRHRRMKGLGHRLLDESDATDLALAAEARPVPWVVPKRPGRNDPCPCGSGRKFKKCCSDAV